MTHFKKLVTTLFLLKTNIICKSMMNLETINLSQAEYMLKQMPNPDQTLSYILYDKKSQKSWLIFDHVSKSKYCSLTPPQYTTMINEENCIHSFPINIANKLPISAGNDPFLLKVLQKKQSITSINNNWIYIYCIDTQMETTEDFLFCVSSHKQIALAKNGIYSWVYITPKGKLLEHNNHIIRSCINPQIPTLLSNFMSPNGEMISATWMPTAKLKKNNLGLNYIEPNEKWTHLKMCSIDQDHLFIEVSQSKLTFSENYSQTQGPENLDDHDYYFNITHKGICSLNPCKNNIDLLETYEKTLKNHKGFLLKNKLNNIQTIDYSIVCNFNNNIENSFSHYFANIKKIAIVREVILHPQNNLPQQRIEIILYNPIKIQLHTIYETNWDEKHFKPLINHKNLFLTPIAFDTLSIFILIDFINEDPYLIVMNPLTAQKIITNPIPFFNRKNLCYINIKIPECNLNGTYCIDPKKRTISSNKYFQTKKFFEQVQQENRSFADTIIICKTN